MNRPGFSFAALLFASLFFLQFNASASDQLRVYISVDMEGIAGVVDSEQVRAGGQDYQLARQWTTSEANAAIQGAFDAGATEVLVNDSHGGMRNIIASDLHPEARLITGSPKPLSMMEGLDESFDAVIFIGYHTKAGSFDGVLDHTYSSASVFSLKVNDTEMGEAEVNSLIAGYFGVPVVMVAGDRNFCEQAREMIGDHLVTAAVKEGIGRTAANTLVPEKAADLVRSKTVEALNGLDNAQVRQPASPAVFEVTFLYSSQAEAAELIPDVKRTGPRSVEFSRDDFIEAFKLFRAVLLVARN